ncbi:hypothetical protein [Cohnella nanjingensis]|uniref:Uncharacterized protein n=1 Tax=Cohnella nanjingensis TaxID=1387779 RepID=A0A7X0VGA3_9BACL|nr:hypothetical protein [Cohnella nanjingensis]MBB6672641.1 hypothetical protein [Cohnella nanjingensis]
MEFNEEQTKLIREYIHLSELVHESLHELKVLETSRVTLKDLNMRMTKMFGTYFNARLKDAQKAMWRQGINVRKDDQGGEIVYFDVTVRGVKSRFGIKRIVLEDELRVMCDKLGKQIENAKFEEYKVEVKRQG